MTGTSVAILSLLAVLAYTYLGYPLAIGLLARLRRWRPTPAAGALPTVTICLPIYNGAGYLPAKIASLLAQDYPSEFDILVYCDGCSDDSEAVARSLAATPAAGGRVRVIANPERSGKPTGLNRLGPAATGELLLLNDVRQPLAPNALRALATALADPTVGCATGNLVLAGSAGSGVYWRYENWIRRQESVFRGVVGMTGPIGMIRRADLRPLQEDLILDDVWIPMRIALTGKRTVFVVEAEARDTAFGDEREFQRKVRTLAGNYQLFARMPALLSRSSTPSGSRPSRTRSSAWSPPGSWPCWRRCRWRVRDKASGSRPSPSARSPFTPGPRWARVSGESPRWPGRSWC
jgi:cellulose synthase/poly-beta-1,6-N-acetylglucosamine synthase-like glycosyltransferase